MSLQGLIAAGAATGGLTDDERTTLAQLWKVWTAKLTRNMLRTQYYEQHNRLKDLGISIPPHLTDLELALGWPAKAVDVLARRCKLNTFAVPGVDGDPFGVNELWWDNDMTTELGQTITSALIHSCAFITVTKGNPLFGEPEVHISSQSALHGSGLWDSKLRRLKAALSVTGVDEIGRVTSWVMFLPNVTVSAVYDNGWSVDRHVHSLDRLPVEVIAYKPLLHRPFGMSRITRDVMGLTDSALRTLVRMEVHAEFFSSPQRYAMGADETMFMDADGNPVPQWEAIMGRVWAAPRDPDTGDVPQLGQFPQSSPQPHSEQLRTLAAQFCAMTAIPMYELGLSPEANPASAQALEASERPLVNEVTSTTAAFGPRIARAMMTAVQIRDNLDEPPPGMRNLEVLWNDPQEMPKSAAGDFLIKLIQAMPWLAESKVPLQQLGWDTSTIDRAWADKRTASVSQLIQSMTAPPQPPSPESPGAGNGG